jgi:transcriptional regulator with XRE-family HTH domain
MPEIKLSAVERNKEVGRLILELREGRKMSIRDVARKAGCSPSFLSQVEKGQSSPSLESLQRIAKAFEFSVLELLSLAQERESTLVLKQGPAGQSLGLWPGASLSHLLPFHIPAPMSLLYLKLSPRRSTARRVSQQTMKELGVVIKGDVECTIGRTKHQLAQGEMIYFDLIIPHFWRNTGDSTACVLLINPNFTQVFDVPESRSKPG